MVPTEEREPTQPTNSEEQPERFVPTSEHFNLAWKRLKKKQEHAQPLQETPKIKHTQQALQRNEIDQDKARQYVKAIVKAQDRQMLLIDSVVMENEDFTALHANLREVYENTELWDTLNFQPARIIDIDELKKRIEAHGDPDDLLMLLENTEEIMGERSNEFIANLVDPDTGNLLDSEVQADDLIEEDGGQTPRFDRDRERDNQDQEAEIREDISENEEQAIASVLPEGQKERAKEVMGKLKDIGFSTVETQIEEQVGNQEKTRITLFLDLSNPDLDQGLRNLILKNSESQVESNFKEEIKSRLDNSGIPAEIRSPLNRAISSKRWDLPSLKQAQAILRHLKLEQNDEKSYALYTKKQGENPHNFASISPQSIGERTDGSPRYRIRHEARQTDIHLEYPKNVVPFTTLTLSFDIENQT